MLHACPFLRYSRCSTIISHYTLEEVSFNTDLGLAQSNTIKTNEHDFVEHGSKAYVFYSTIAPRRDSGRYCIMV